MTALLSAPWYFLAGFAFFGLVLVAVACWAVVNWALDNWPGDVDDPSIFYADDSRDPSKEK